MGSTDRVKRPSWMRENSSSSSTMLVSRRASETMIPIPFFTSPASRTSPFMMVSAQPLIAVRGVRSSWDTDDINSFFIFSLWLIFSDMSLMVSVRAPISSS